jgi:hypothetical protein
MIFPDRKDIASAVSYIDFLTFFLIMHLEANEVKDKNQKGSDESIADLTIESLRKKADLQVEALKIAFHAYADYLNLKRTGMTDAKLEMR